MDEINQLIAEYNAVEIEQQARLRALFAAVKARHGFRSVNFEGPTDWNNCWDMPEARLDEIYFAQLQRKITAIQPGSE